MLVQPREVINEVLRIVLELNLEDPMSSNQFCILLEVDPSSQEPMVRSLQLEESRASKGEREPARECISYSKGEELVSLEQFDNPSYNGLD